MSDARVDPSPPAALLEESAEDLYENAPCGYLSTLPDGVIVKVNQTFLDWTGYRREDLLDRRRLVDLLPPGGRIYHETHYAPLLRMQGSVREIAVEVLRADGTRLPVLLNSLLRRDAEGRPRLVRTTIFNATVRKEYERELLRARQKAEAADRLKADFISMISHEIRTPLNAIIGVGYLLASTPLSPQQQKYVKTLRSSSESLLSLINEILDFSKIQSGKVKVEERPLDLREVVATLLTTLQVKADEKAIALVSEIDPAVPERLLGDPVKISQVLTNLVGNAIKFTAQGSVTVALEAREPSAEAVTVAFRVTDTGIGIDPERLPHIFEDFTQASYEIGQRFGGSGLGLAISRRLVELHGSRIDVRSTVGQGSEFSFVLRLPRAPATAEPPPPEPEVGAVRGLKVLVADDNEANAFVLTGLLTEWGVAYDTVANGRDAVACARRNAYDMVLMDLHMPELDGYDAVREIRALGGAYAELPIIAVSGSTRIGDPRTLAASGFTDFVGKPISPAVLLDRIRRLARRTA